MSSWGERVKLTIFGESHGPMIGMVLEGLPAGETIDLEAVKKQMARRAPGNDPTATARKESDTPIIVSGVCNQVTTGAPLCAVIENSNQHSGDYESLKNIPRPGHADYAAFLRYHGFSDLRGGGHFSGRLTAPLVLAGAICRQILERRGIVIGAHAYAIHDVFDTPFDSVNINTETLSALNTVFFPVIDSKVQEKMRQEIETTRLQTDSVGGIVECACVGIPGGYAEEGMFGGVESILSSILFGIPACKGVEFGDGFKVSSLFGSENNDSYFYDETGSIKTHTNHAGGILGGITTGMPLIFRCAFKPTPSIAKEQDSVDLSAHRNVKLQIKGRHDPCIVPRAIPVVEAAAALAVMNLWRD